MANKRTPERDSSGKLTSQGLAQLTRFEIEDLEPLRGWVSTYYRYYKGKKLGPYYVRRWKECGKTFRQYIKPKDVERVKAQCQLNREYEFDLAERGRRIRRFIINGDFFLRILLHLRRRKGAHPVHYAFYERIMQEGIYISGRPPLRRKVTRHPVSVDGENMIRMTVFEIDGTTKVFMVSPLTNTAKSLPSRTYDDIYNILADLFLTDEEKALLTPDRRSLISDCPNAQRRTPSASSPQVQ